MRSFSQLQAHQPAARFQYNPIDPASIISISWTRGPSTPQRASSASAGKSFCVHSPNSRPINPRQGQSLDGSSEGPGWKAFWFVSSLSQHRALQPPGEHHQHQLEKTFAFTLPTPGSTRGKVPVQPNHWTDLAKDPAGIISISWKTFLFLSFTPNTGPFNPATSIISISWKMFLRSLSQLQALQPVQINPIIERI